MEEGEEDYLRLQSVVNVFLSSLQQFESNGINDQSTSQLCSVLGDELISLVSEVKATEKLKNEVKDLILQLERNRDDEDSSPSRRTHSGNTFAGIDTRTRQQVEDENKGFEVAILDNENQIENLNSKNIQIRMQIDAGPGWTEGQIHQKNELLEQIEVHGNVLNQNREKLASLQVKISEANESINSANMDQESAKDKLDHLIQDIKEIMEETQVEEARCMKFHCDKDAVALKIKQVQELDILKEQELKQLNDNRLLNQSRCEKIQADIKAHSEHQRKLEEECVRVSQELSTIRIANKATKEENDEKLKLLKVKEDEIQSITKICNKSKQEVCHLTEQLQAVEMVMKENETKRDELKMKLGRLETVDLKAAQRESDTLQRVVERLRREEQALDRNSSVTERKSDAILDLISAQETKLMNLHIELKDAKRIATQKKSDIERLKQDQEVKCFEIEKISSRYNALMHAVHEQDIQVTLLEAQIEELEARVRSKHDLCSSIKLESNRESKQLHENQEKIEQLFNDHTTIRRQIKTCQFDMAKVESSLIGEHFLHYSCDVESDDLRKSVAALRDEISSIDTMIEQQSSEIQKLCDAIQEGENNHDRLLTENCKLVTERDIIISKLSHSEGHLATIQESLSSQKLEMKTFDKELHDVTDQLTSLTTSIQKLHKQLLQASDELKYQDECIARCRDLENQLKEVRYQNKVLNEELNRPINIHRWRLLEHLDPQRYEKIQRLQKVQRKFMETSDEVADLNRIISEKEKILYQLKISKDRIPQKNELQEELSVVNKVFNERMDELKKLTKEMESHRKEVEQLTKILESTRRDMKSRSRIANSTFSS